MRQRSRASREQARAHAKHWALQRSGEGITYVALGDSAGVGIGVDDPAASYVARVARALQADSGGSINVVNLSVSGARIADLLENQIPQLNELARVDYVTCVIGGNDVAWSRKFDPDGVGQRLDAVAAHLPSRSILGLVPSFWHWPYEARAKTLNGLIEAAAQKHGHSVADIYSKTKSLGLRRYLGTLSKDYFHPNAYGYKLWADAIVEAPNFPR